MARKIGESAAEQAAPASKPPSAPAKKTAVVVIHGMGEQWPMDTLEGFVGAVWSRDPEVVGRRTGQIFFKPEQISGSFELRRITTRPWAGAHRRRVDFFEFYWAHLMPAASLGAVISWATRLLLRRPSRVPRRLLGGWIAGLVAVGLAVGLWLLSLLQPAWVPVWLWSGLGVIGAAFSAVWLRPVAGDAARYLSPSPGNVAVRQAIREAGVDLLKKLHATKAYDRIIVVGHSLGTVIGYDVLNYAWGRIPAAEFERVHVEGSSLMQRLGALERAAGDLAVHSPPAAARSAYRTAQRAYFEELARQDGSSGDPLWLVSDFVTLGSPLSSSDVLLARDAQALETRKAAREAPTSPPWLEKLNPPRFSYPLRDAARVPHHAAVFGPTVWTNVYFPNVLGLIGDFVSGPVAPQLGPGVRDVRVPIGAPVFRHLDYWRDPQANPPWIRALRRAINLRGDGEAALWREEVDANPVRAERLPETLGKPPSGRAPGRAALGTEPRLP